MANTAQNPWAPDPDNKPGVLGEHGSSAFIGNADFDEYDSADKDAGAGRANPGANGYGDAPTSASDETATAFVFRDRVSNQAHEDARRAQRDA